VSEFLRTSCERRFIERVHKDRLLVLSGLAVGAVWYLATINRSEASPFKFLPDTYIGTLCDNDYVGSDACKDCHEDQFKAFSQTSHANLANISSWKGRVTGCEACHGPGKPTLKKVTQLKSSHSRTNRQKRFPRPAYLSRRQRGTHGGFQPHDLTDSHGPLPS
jgi:hypothetical protein